MCRGNIVNGVPSGAIRCDWCGYLSGVDGAWTSGGFGCGLCHGDTHCRERESSKKSNCVGTTGVLGMSCTLGSLTVLWFESREMVKETVR